MKPPEIPVRLTVGDTSAIIGTLNTMEPGHWAQSLVISVRAHPDWRKSLADLLRATADEIDPPGEVTA